VPHHGSQAYAIAADPCFVIADVVVDGVSQGAIPSYTFADVVTDHTIAVTFATVVHTSRRRRAPAARSTRRARWR